MSDFKLSGFDKFMLRIAPEWTRKRLRSRVQVDALIRAYDAAAPGRRTQGWRRNQGDANAANAVAIRELRMHARDLVRNNSWAKRPVKVIANNVVGWGIVPQPSSDDAELNQEAALLWKRWADSTECDPEGRLTFYALQHLVMRTVVISGECLVRFRPRLPKDKLSIPLQLQVLEPDYLDASKQAPTSEAGGPIIYGVEFDLIGRRAAYWLFPQHPGGLLATQESKRIPASEVVHVSYQERPHETRGVSWFGSAIVNLKDLDEYEDAELMRQKIAACFSAFVTDMDGVGSPLGAVDSANPKIERLEPGMIIDLPPGKSVSFGNPPSTASDNFTTRNLRKIAAGLGVTYEDLTGDYSQVNFSSARMGRLAHQGHVVDWQWNMLVPQLCRPVWDRAMSEAAGAGEISGVPTANWSVPAIPMIEPDKEILALMRAVRTGAMTFDDMLREQGKDPAEHWSQYSANLKLLDSLGIKLDSDTRAVSQTGQAQMSPPDVSTEKPTPT